MTIHRVCGSSRTPQTSATDHCWIVPVLFVLLQRLAARSKIHTDLFGEQSDPFRSERAPQAARFSSAECNTVSSSSSNNHGLGVNVWRVAPSANVISGNRASKYYERTPSKEASTEARLAHGSHNAHRSFREWTPNIRIHSIAVSKTLYSQYPQSLRSMMLTAQAATNSNSERE